jgi:hypothetical protein
VVRLPINSELVFSDYSHFYIWGQIKTKKEAFMNNKAATLRDIPFNLEKHVNHADGVESNRGE